MLPFSLTHVFCALKTAIVFNSQGRAYLTECRRNNDAQFSGENEEEDKAREITHTGLVVPQLMFIYEPFKYVAAQHTYIK
jgi:hypothetical protein